MISWAPTGNTVKNKQNSKVYKKPAGALCRKNNFIMVKITYPDKVKYSIPCNVLIMPWRPAEPGVCWDLMKKLLFTPFPLAAILVLLVSAVCSGCYTIKQGTTMLGYLNRAITLEDLAAGTDANAEENRLFATQVADIRRFTTEELGMKESKNYTRYVELDRNYLAAVVSASAQDSFTRHEWRFPVIGKAPYKGFFNVEDARKERAKLEKKGLDVWIRGVDAFSTLGWFRDPLYSYMKDYALGDLADLIIHEQLHATVYIKNQSQFNEELAEFVGTEGARLYMESVRGEAEPSGKPNDDDAANAKADSAAYLAYIRGLITDLDRIYKNQNLSREEKLARKAETIARSKAEFEDNYDNLFITDNYHFFSSLPINNAYLELYRLYYEDNTWYKDLYERSGKDLKAFIAAAKTVKGKKDPKAELEKALLK